MIDIVIAPNPSAYTLDGTRTYVIDERIVVDPGPDIDSHVEQILLKATRLEAILITHRHADHAPAATHLRRRSGAPVYAPRHVIEHVDVELHDDVTLDVGGRSIRVLHTPGHTAEHVCFFTAERELFTGDTILGEGTTVIFPPDGHMGSYMKTLHKLSALEPRIIYPGHGRPREDAAALINGYIAHRQLREEQIAAALGAGASSPEELRRAIYTELDPRLEEAAVLQLEAHLEHMKDRGVVRKSGDRWQLQ
jgi:glyoxylase-like metal-dependent hydrolase (beta-lactamase superfamily II)